MLDIEWECANQEYCQPDQNVTYDLEACSFEGHSIADDISIALSDLKHSEHTFAFFNLGLSTYELEVLEKISIKCTLMLTYLAEENAFQDKAANLLSLCATENNDTEASRVIGNIITRVTSNIIAASNYSDALIEIRGKHTESSFFPGWHIDKTFEEILDINNAQSQNHQPVFIFTLKGPTTLFQSTDKNTHNSFKLITKEFTYSYGYDKEALEANRGVIEQMFDYSQSHSTTIGQASVHLAGYNSGTIHSVPNLKVGDERLVVLVTPGHRKDIKAILNL